MYRKALGECMCVCGWRWHGRILTILLVLCRHNLSKSALNESPTAPLKARSVECAPVVRHNSRYHLLCY